MDVEEICRIELLGPLRIVCGGEVLTHFRTKQAAWLLGLLATVPGHSLRREHLTDLFWPEMDLEHGRNNLSNRLASLHRIPGKIGAALREALIADREWVRFQPERIETDVGQLERLAAAARAASSKAEKIRLLSSAAALHRGELLQGLDLPPGEDAGIQGARSRASEVIMRALQEWAALVLDEDPERALLIIQRAQDIDPVREEPYRLEMEAYARLHRSDGVVRTYQRLVHVLARELDDLPSPRTVDLYARLHPGGAARPLPATPSSAPASLPPASLPLPNSKFALPLYQTALFGREEELGDLSALLLSSARLVTLTGPGGVGKTRLAVEAARRAAGEFSGRVWFLGLEGLTDAARLLSFVVDAMRIGDNESADAVDRFATAVCGIRCLVLLDNFEQLLAEGSHARSVMRALADRAPSVTFLITSREPLKLSGEREVVVEPLPVPQDHTAPDVLERYSAVALYLDRARAAGSEVCLTSENALYIAALSRQLEGMPLAIEMAAALIRHLPPRALLEKLDTEYDVLQSRHADVPSRHRTQTATIEWSYQSLPKKHRAFFAALSVFQGGWTLEAAQEVCAGRGVDARESLALLVDRSLVRTAETNGEARYRFLEELRRFSARKLPSASRKRLSFRHLLHFTKWSEEARGHLGGRQAGRWLDRLDANLDNLRAALQLALDMGLTEEGLRLAGSLWRYWYARGSHVEGVGWLNSLLDNAERAVPACSPQVRLEALGAAGNLHYCLGQYALARSRFEEMLALAQEKSPEIVPRVLGHLANIASADGCYSLAGRLFTQVRTIYEERGDRRGVATTIANQAINARHDGAAQTASALYEEAIGLFRVLADQVNVALALNNYADLRIEMRRLGEAATLLAESIRLSHSLRAYRTFTHGLFLCSVLALEGGDAWRAAVLRGAEDALRERHDERLPAGALPQNLQVHHRILTVLGRHRFLEAAEYGRDMATNLDLACEYALHTIARQAE